jgi:osmoprotectant transport system permease protein
MGVFLLLVFNTSIWESVLTVVFPGEEEVVYPRAGLARLTGEHLLLVAASSIAALLIGVPLGVFVTREQGRGFKSIVNDLGSLSQTIPPVAVLALAVPAIGFGFKPTVVALFLYSILPILRNTVAGLEQVPPATKEAAKGMGMTRWQLLLKVELPLAAPIIFAGVRISMVINVGTATIGAVVGAGGLGNPIISGLIRDNPAFVIQGAITAALLAVLIDQIISRVEKSVTPGSG